MYLKSVTGGNGTGTVCVTVADERSGGIEKLFISSKIWSSLEIAPDASSPVDEETYALIRSAADRTSALREASRMIGSGEKSRNEIRRRLRSKKIPDDAADYAVKVLEKNGYIDDVSSCARLAEAMVSSKHYGKRRVLEYLLSHGYDRQAAVDAVSSVPPEEYSSALQYNILHKYPGVAEADMKEKQKITAGLVRLGFSYSEAEDGIREYIRNT